MIEAVHENIDAKKAVFKRLDALCKPETIFASNTSSLYYGIRIMSSQPKKEGQSGQARNHYG
ncbi:MAG: 3-hydroxyacyl-CoA dehydrogenase NAD-binding domain-containing protein [Desulfomonilaceae bacterium]